MNAIVAPFRAAYNMNIPVAVDACILCTRPASMNTRANSPDEKDPTCLIDKAKNRFVVGDKPGDSAGQMQARWPSSCTRFEQTR